jgi:hypothetical protein
LIGRDWMRAIRTLKSDERTAPSGCILFAAFTTGSLLVTLR